MKRYVLFVGGTGARAAEALLCAACAGVLQADTLEVLLADTDRRGLRSAELLKAKYADYARVQSALSEQAQIGAARPFQTEMNLHAWPERLPGGAAPLREWTAGSETDALLCQALFDPEAASLDLREGFHGRRALGQTVFAGLLNEAAAHEDDALTALIADMQEALEAGEEVRAVLAGSVCGGTGAAGLPMLARHIQAQTQGRARLGAVLLAASGDHEDAAKGKEAIAAFARESACSAVCVLGLPKSSCTSAPADYAHLTDWLAIYCMDVLLHRPTWPEGLFTVQADMKPLTWDVFGKAAERYRIAYGRLMKAAAAWTYAIGPQVKKRMEKPLYLRDCLFGWYAHFFRRARDISGACLEDAECLTRLMSVVLLWLGGLMKTLPPEMTHAAELAEAQETAQSHYAALAELVGQLTMLDEVAQKDEDYEDGMVYRHHTEDDSEAEKAQQRIEAVKQEIERRTAEQERLNRRMGGAATMRLLQEALEDAQSASEELRQRYDEANRRIAHAESIAAPEDQYRITDARTKLQRMVRHQQMLDVRESYIRADVERVSGEEARFAKPAVAGSGEGNGMFHRGLTSRLLTQERRLTRSEVEALWPEMVQPADGRTLRQALRSIKKAPVDEAAPVMSLLHALIRNAMEEV